MGKIVDDDGIEHDIEEIDPLDADDLRSLAELLRATIPRAFGFCLVVFEYAADLPRKFKVNYVSSAPSSDTAKLLRETARRLESN